MGDVMSRVPSDFKVTNVKRAIAAARAAGESVDRVDIASHKPASPATIGIAPLANLRLKFVHTFKDRHGAPRHYFRRPGFKVIALPGLPGSTEFMRAYRAALASETAPLVEIAPPVASPAASQRPWRSISNQSPLVI
jgi:hypothetical protein